MEAIKKAFGVILLATAVWLVSPVIPVVAQMLAWALLLIVPAIYLHALDPVSYTHLGWPYRPMSEPRYRHRRAGGIHSPATGNAGHARAARTADARSA